MLKAHCKSGFGSVSGGQEGRTPRAVAFASFGASGSVREAGHARFHRGQRRQIIARPVEVEEAAADIGANLLYRYVDGVLTEEPLWDPTTGVFPHGAVIEGSPNDPAEHAVTAATIHEHLNVNTNGCRLPYATDASKAKRGAVPCGLCQARLCKRLVVLMGLAFKRLPHIAFRR